MVVLINHNVVPPIMIIDVLYIKHNYDVIYICTHYNDDDDENNNKIGIIIIIYHWYSY